MFRQRISVALLSLFFSVPLGAYDLPPFALRTNDVVAFVGGSMSLRRNSRDIWKRCWP